MSVVSLRPNGTRAPNPATTTGAANPHSALSDGTILSPNTSSYVELAGGAGHLVLDMTTTTKPANSRVKSLKVNHVVSSSTTTSSRQNTWVQVGDVRWGFVAAYIQPDTTARQSYGPFAARGDLTQAQIDSLLVYLGVPQNRVAVRTYETEVQITFQHAPTTTITSSGGTISESEYTVEWSHTPGDDGGPQVAYRVRVFSEDQYSDAGFNPLSSPAMIDTGVVPGGASAYTITGLSPGSYKVAVRSAQSYLGGLHHFAAAYDTEDITVDVEASEVSAVAAVIDDDTGLVTVTVDRDTGSDAWDHIELQRTANRDLLGGIGDFDTGADGVGAGWTKTTAATLGTDTLSLSSSSGYDGQYQRIQGSGTAAASNGIESDFIPVLPDTPYVLSMVCKRDLEVTGGLTAHYQTIVWYDSGRNLISAGGLGRTTDLADWTRESVFSTSPPNARYAKVSTRGARLTGSGNSWDISVDQIRFAAWDDNWEDVRGADQLTPGTNQVVALDWETPPHRSVVYRARAVDANGLLGEWVYSVAVEWSIEEGIWIKSIEDPARNIKLRLFSPPTPTYPGRRSIHWPAGASKPVSTSDVRGGRTIRFGVRTLDETERQALLALLTDDVWLFQFAEAVNFEPGYFAVGDITESHLTRYGAFPYRDWEVEAVEVQTP